MNFLKFAVDKDIYKKRERLKEMLQKNDVASELKANIEELIYIMPEFKEMIEKLLELQYADARAHAPETVEKRVKVLDQIKREIELKKCQSQNVGKESKNFIEV